MVSSFLLYGCVANLSSIQRRSIEVKELKGNFEDGFRATMAVLQDRGYVIKHTDYNAGVIQAETIMKTNILGGYSYSVTVTIEQFGKNRLKERITFIKKTITDMGQHGKTVDSRIVYDPAWLQQVYDEIQKEIFIRQNLSR